MYFFIEQIKEKKSKLKIIFLDIDGTIYRDDDIAHTIHLTATNPRVRRIPATLLNTLSLYDLSAALKFSQKAVRNVCKLCEEYDAKIVISSAWRENKSIEQVKNALLKSSIG